jgi:hypothetical protein
LQESGHVIRGTTRDPGRVPELRAAGIEPYVGDPDRIGTLVAALEQVSVACVLLGSAVGDPERVEALHTTRLEMLLTKLLDTTARGIVYEARGTVAPEVLDAGAHLVRSVCGRSRIPYELLDADPFAPAWVDAAAIAVGRVLSGGSAPR